jgi:hypothetical protein
MDGLELLFVVWAFLFQAILIAHFALRKWRFRTAMRYGWTVYALSLPAVIVSGVLLLGGRDWWLWVSGFVCLAWSVYGYTVEYVKKIEWRDPIHWSVFGPYVFLYFWTVMFYWWPLARISQPLWVVYTALFLVSTVLNITSHGGAHHHGSVW